MTSVVAAAFPASRIFWRKVTTHPPDCSMPGGPGSRIGGSLQARKRKGAATDAATVGAADLVSRAAQEASSSATASRGFMTATVARSHACEQPPGHMLEAA